MGFLKEFTKENAESKEKQLDVLIRARYPIIYILSWEEDRVMDTLHSIAKYRNKFLMYWTSTEGLRGVYGSPPLIETTLDPLVALDYIINEEKDVVCVFKDLHPYLNEGGKGSVIRKLRETSAILRNSKKTIILLSPILAIPVELEKEVTVFDFPLPAFNEMKNLLEELVQSVGNHRDVKVMLDEEARERMAKAALGLTIGEAERVFAKVLVSDNVLDENDIPKVMAEKEQVIRKSGILEYYELNEQFSNIGGLVVLKEWLTKRTNCFSEKARQFGLPDPKGILLIGVQGCGKSLASKAIAANWNLPLLRLDVGRVFSGLVGASEENIRKAIKISESVSPCVLWIDEIEKGFAGVQSSSFSDAGATARVFATFLTWLQEKKAPVFVTATANDITQLPPELLRKGRFDEIFFVDLPNINERKEIFKIHLSKRSRKPDFFDLERLAKESEGWSGAEIEQAVIASLFDVFALGRDITTEDLLKNIGESVPLSQTYAEQICELRLWAKTRARFAS